PPQPSSCFSSSTTAPSDQSQNVMIRYWQKLIEAGTYPTDLFSKFTGPSDTERSAAYSDVLKYVDTLDTAFAQEAEGRDASEIARAVANLADMPAGQRPLRASVPDSPVIDETNRLLAAYQERLFTKYGLQTLLRQ
ncbi:hypothetical protein AB0N87_44065, partial [Streptomyces sp. NPDC093228]|uniref:hypothetical protein n=1 Tax=Streptomyces sp. NPDC093228 TaxID=3155070 RepID=UPI003423ECBB